MIFSIDQNSHSLWDTLPKLQALARRGYSTTHYLEDVDVAFTHLGSDIDDESLRILPERYHPSGGMDWGAALFYSDFLGRLPLELRHWEEQLGMKVSQLAKQLGEDLPALYDRYSTSDNHMLVGSSYIGDKKHHRTIADLGVSETAEALRQIFALARDNCLESFPAQASQDRLGEWFAEEEARLDSWVREVSDSSLVALYRRWLEEYLGSSVRLDLTSRMMAVGADEHRTALLELFTRDYEHLAGLYNQAIEESQVSLHPLAVKRGELPFFAVFRHEGHAVRSECFLQDGVLVIAGREFPLGPDGRLPLETLRAGGIEALPGKAVLLILQARIGENGGSLALPHQGSLYTPAVHCFQKKLEAEALLPAPLEPILRVRFHLLDRLRDIDTPIRLPAHLAAYFGAADIPARQLGEEYDTIITRSRKRLEQFTTEAGREAWLQKHHARKLEQIDALEQEKRDLAQENPKDPHVRELWKQIKALQNDLLSGVLHRVTEDVQCSQLEYWDSRGAILPWCIALDGESFYNSILHDATITEETP